MKLKSKESEIFEKNYNSVKLVDMSLSLKQVNVFGESNPLR